VSLFLKIGDGLTFNHLSFKLVGSIAKAKVHKSVMSSGLYYLCHHVDHQGDKSRSRKTLKFSQNPSTL